MTWDPHRTHVDMLCSHKFKGLLIECARADGYWSVSSWMRAVLADRMAEITGRERADILSDEHEHRGFTGRAVR